jgi:crotonobetainyl-CoA:carnitine CoA-transferase CaiB-like acyl-CoA transferase
MVRVPDADTGTLPMHAVIPRLSGTPGGLARPAPRLGEHSVDVLRGAGVSDAAIQELLDRKIIAS